MSIELLIISEGHADALLMPSELLVVSDGTGELWLLILFVLSYNLFVNEYHCVMIDTD